MPPEQISAEPLDRRVDIWALGMVLYELLTLRRPFEAQQDAAMMKAILFEDFIPLPTLRPEVPPALVAIVNRCLKKDRHERFATARELQAQLEKFISSHGHSIGSYEIESFVLELSEGRAPRAGASTLPSQAALPVLRGERPPALTTTAPAGGPGQTITEEADPGGARTVSQVTTREEPSRRRTAEPRRAPLLGGLALVAVLGAVGVWAPRTSREGGQEVVSADAGSASAASRPGVGAASPGVTALADAGADEPGDPGQAVAAADSPADAGVRGAAPDALEALASGGGVDAGGGMAPGDAVVRRADAGTKRGRRERVPVEFRLLPEGSVLVGGAPFTGGLLESGKRRVVFVSRRFGEVTRDVEVPACGGRVLVGYSFSSDRLTVSCR
jgi:serine/threonine-protein kinase